MGDFHHRACITANYDDVVEQLRVYRRLVTPLTGVDERMNAHREIKQIKRKHITLSFRRKRKHADGSESEFLRDPCRNIRNSPAGSAGKDCNRGVALSCPSRPKFT